MSSIFQNLIVILIFFIASNVQSCFAQVVSIEYVLDSPIEQRDAINVNQLEFYQTPLAVDFNKWHISDTTILRKLKSKTIYKVELVYSSYRESNKFSQRKLNEKRLIELHKKLPYIFENSAVEWGLIEQLEDESKPKAKALFHGFIFYSRESAVLTSSGMKSLTTDDEIAYVRDLLKAERIMDAIELLPEERCITAHQKECTEPACKFLPRSKRKEDKGILYDKRSIWRRKIHKSTPVCVGMDTVICLSTKWELDSLMKAISGLRTYTVEFDPLTTYSRREDTVVSQTLNSKNWSNVLVIEDVTGSMYPYLGQTLVWRKLHAATTDLNQFTFFNDGDNHPDGPIGRSGGAVYISSSEVEKLEKEAYANMKKGGGGGAPENNIEATLYGVEKCKESYERIVWIADNYANIRDYELLDDLKKTGYPVDIILCGVYSHHVNIHYLQLAMETKGSVYTMEQSLTNLMDLNEGETIEVGKQKFKINKGVFVLVR